MNDEIPHCAHDIVDATGRYQRQGQQFVLSITSDRKYI